MNIRPIIKVNVLLLTVVGLLASCAEEATVMTMGELSTTPILLEATSAVDEVGTRASATWQNKAFDDQTQLSVYISTNEGTPRTIGTAPITYIATNDGTTVNTLTPSSQPYYPDGGTTVNIYGVFPPSVAPGGDGTMIFNVLDTQTAADSSDYQACDLMQAQINAQSKTDQTLRLIFNHKMAKLIVHATAEEEVEITGIKLVNAYRSVKFTPSTGALGELSNSGEIVFNNHDAVLFPPQTISDNFLEVSTANPEGKAYFKVNGGKTFESGKEYTISLTIGRINLGLTANITNWTQDGATQTIADPGAENLEVTYAQSVTYGSVPIPYTQPDLVVKYKENGGGLTTWVRKDHVAEGEPYDYEVKLFGNDKAGTATMVISGNPDDESKRNIAVVKSFTIKQGTGELRYPAYTSAASYGYSTNDGNTQLEVPFVSGQKVNWPLTITGDGTMTYVSTNEKVATVVQSGANKGDVIMHSVGHTTIMASMDGDKNYTAHNAQYELEVTKRTASGMTIVLSPTSYTFNGNPCTPTVTVYDGDTNTEPLQIGVDYTVSYSNNVYAGTATVTVTGAGDYGGTISKNFPINPITTVFHEDYNGSSVIMAKNKTLERPATINHAFGTVTYTSSNTNVATVSANGTVITGNATGTTTITVSVAADAQRYTGASMTYTVTVESYDADYTAASYVGKVTEFTCRQTGTYQLEVWGASGGTAHSNYPGGNGAYIVGTIHLTYGQKLYVYVGAQGGTSGAGGWNGGGSCTNGSKNASCTGGGGATDIALCNGTWNSTEHLNSRIIVAAGGGGGLYFSGGFFTQGLAAGGYGGAWDGRSGYGANAYGRGATISSAGKSGSGNTTAAGFGYGGNYTGSSIVGCGGGGWYGGGSGGDHSRHGAGGGGSSYMWNADNAKYYNGHGTNNMPTVPSGSVATDPTSFYVTQKSINYGANEGHGKARITFISTD